MESEENKVEILDHFDVVLARQLAREAARQMGFDLSDQTRIAAAVSQVAHRVLAKRGKIHLSIVSGGIRRGLECTCSPCEWLGDTFGPLSRDNGNGEEPSEDLAGLQRLMDDIELRPFAGQRAVVMRKWLA
jgi:serine/threonine-protein kinase RsbT